MIEPTHSEEYLLRSVKKFFIDTFQDDDYLNVPVFFDVVQRTPVVSGVDATEWLCVIAGGIDVATLTQGFFQIILMVTGDVDGLKLAKFRDLVVAKLQDFDENDGCARIPIYDTYWKFSHASVLGLKDDLGTNTLEDGLKMKIIPFVLRWGAK